MSFSRSEGLAQPDVLCSWTLWPLPRVVGDTLSFTKFFVAYPFKVGHVKEHVVACSSVDETETLVRQPLDRTFCHLQSES